MSTLLSIQTDELADEGLDYEIVNLASSDLSNDSVELESDSLESIPINESRISAVEDAVAELQSEGNVRYDIEQELTEEEQTQARANISSASLEHTHSHSDIADWGTATSSFVEEEALEDYALKTEIPDVSGLQEKIADLDDIRSGAALGATSLQPDDISDWAKQDTKPTYTAQEVGALPEDTVIPTSLSQLSSDESHRTVTDSEKSAWDSKSDFSGSYNDLTDTPVIPDPQVRSDWNATSGVAEILNKPTIPTALSQLTEDASHRTVSDTEKNTWDAKQDTISDLDDIRAGANLGSTSLQSEEDPVFNSWLSDFEEDEALTIEEVDGILT